MEQVHSFLQVKQPSLAEAKKLKTHSVETNLNQGSYRPRFFDLGQFGVSKVVMQSVMFSSGQAEACIVNGKFSFGYLREDKLRTIDVYNREGERVSFDKFLSTFGIEMQSQNLFKTGKYLSRVFRPVRYGEFFRDLDIYINDNPAYSGKITDGISLISVELAHALGYRTAKNGDSAQFTLFFDKGLIKGNCVVSDKIGHDVVIYGNDNIKSELSLGQGLQYVTLEPLKLGKKLRMDIQSLLNLWEVFGADQYLMWTFMGIEQFKEDLFAGKLSYWLDDFEDISLSDYEDETWTLRKAIWHKIDYTRYPGLIRLAWTMFKTSLIRFAVDNDGKPVFRIPVAGAMRGYLRIDLRDHDNDGNFNADSDTLTLDGQGNLWVPAKYIGLVCETLGGADQDDSICVVPTEKGQAILYRNPNQYGEVMRLPIRYGGIEVTNTIKTTGSLPEKKKPVLASKTASTSEVKTGNSLLDRFLAQREMKPKALIIPYTLDNLLRAYVKVTENTANIGVAANSEMIRSAIGIIDKETFHQLTLMFNWNLERIIDATVKEGIDAREDMKAVQDLMNYVHDKGIEVPESLLNRFPQSMQSEVRINRKHPLDELLEAIKYLVREADKEVLGEGSVSRGNRIPGRIDSVEPPFIDLGQSTMESPVYDLAISLLKGYNRSLAILLENTKELPLATAEAKRKEGIERIQTKLLQDMTLYSGDERSAITRILMYEIYKSSRAVHDSILWIGDKDSLKGTSTDTIHMLGNAGKGLQVKYDRGLVRVNEQRNESISVSSIRLWMNKELTSEMFSGIGEVLIEGGKAILGGEILNLGDECRVSEGVYRVRSIVQSTSKKNTRMLLKNSLTVYINV